MLNNNLVVDTSESHLGESTMRPQPETFVLNQRP